MKVWITTVGKSPFAVVNPIWIACRRGEFIPEKVYLLWNDAVADVKSIVRGLVETILKNYGVPDPKIVDDGSVKVAEDDFKRFRKVLLRICDDELKSGKEVAIDMTPGRKFMSALAMGLGFKRNPVKVYYLHLLDLSYQNKPLVLIPFSIQKFQKLYDMKREFYEY